MAPKIIVAENNDEVATELIKLVKSAIDSAEEDSMSKVIIGLSGGSLPKFLAAGMKSDVGQTVDWSKVMFIFCDERLVAFDHPESTFGLYLSLFKDTNIKEEQFLKVAVDLDVESAAKDYEDKIKNLMGEEPRADLLLLGNIFYNTLVPYCVCNFKFQFQIFPSSYLATYLHKYVKMFQAWDPMAIHVRCFPDMIF